MTGSEYRYRYRYPGYPLAAPRLPGLVYELLPVLYLVAGLVAALDGFRDRNLLMALSALILLVVAVVVTDKRLRSRQQALDAWSVTRRRVRR